MLTPISKAMKYLLFLFNFIFLLTGICLIIIGLTINAQNDNIKEAVGEENITSPNILIFIGCFVSVVSFFGCCGALKESHFMIFTFSVVMAAVFVAELAVGISGYALRSDATEALATRLTETMKDYNNSTEVRNMWDGLQGQLNCCGARNYSDWELIDQQLPISCCTPAEGKIGIVACDRMSKDFHKTPCITAISNIIQENLTTIGFTGITFAVIQLLGVVFSCYLAYSIRKDYVTV